jgi:hypothetical protein
MDPSSLRAFQRHQEHDLKHPVAVDLITTQQNKTNYLPSYIDAIDITYELNPKKSIYIVPKCNCIFAQI